MANRGVTEFYFTRMVPPRSVAIAQISTPPLTPSQLTDINNTPLSQGVLGVWLSTSNPTTTPDFTAADYNVDLAISGSTQYFIDNQFFEITGQVQNNQPLYYVHTLAATNPQQVTLLDLAGNIIASPNILVSGSQLFHSMDGAPYRVRYVDDNGYLRTHLLLYSPTMVPSQYVATPVTYVTYGRNLQVYTNGTLYIRFLAPNGYLTLPAYNTPPNTPWYPRIRFGLRPIAPEWGKQVFLPSRPYQLGVWVPGTVLDSTLVEFERKNMFFDASNLPDVLVFDKDYVFKYALDGTLPGTPPRRGTLYNWKRGLIAADNVDWYKARIDLSVTLEPTDLVFGFYSYAEPDVLFRGVDVNPFTNPAVKNKIVEFYFKNDSADPFHCLFFRVKDPATGNYVAGFTNDPNPANTGTLFSSMVVGASIGVQQFTVTDVRQRGGGLAPQWQDIPEAVNFWDLGYWDGKPYPIAGTLMVYLPVSILDRMARSDIQARVEGSLPSGVMPVIRFYAPDGTESV